MQPGNRRSARPASGAELTRSPNVPQQATRNSKVTTVHQLQGVTVGDGCARDRMVLNFNENRVVPSNMYTVVTHAKKATNLAFGATPSLAYHKNRQQ